jgi:hypothetical protein
MLERFFKAAGVFGALLDGLTGITSTIQRTTTHQSPTVLVL